MLRRAAREERRKQKEENPRRKAERRREDTLGRLNVVCGFSVIKTSCLGSFSAPVRAADTNSRRIKYKP